MLSFITPTPLRFRHNLPFQHQHCDKNARQLVAVRRSISTRRPRAIPRPPEPTDEYSPERLGFLHIATITGAHGVRGEVKAKSATDFSKYRLGAGSYTRMQHYLLLPWRKYPRPVTISAGREASQEETWILRIKDVETREQVDSLRGSRLFVKEGDRPRLSGDEFLVGDLVGMKVEMDGEEIGTVESVLTREEICRAAGSGKRGASVGNDLLEVLIGSKKVLIPFVKQVVPLVDCEMGRIEIDPPKGLLDIAVVNEREKKRMPRGLLKAAVD